MRDRRILYVVHNHPSVRPGGAEVYAVGLYEAMRATEGWEPTLLARTGPPFARFDRPHDTPIAAVNGDPNQYFFFTDLEGYDWLNATLRSKLPYTQAFRDLLLALQPDVVHFQHTLFLGYEAIREVRNTLPDAAIVYTLHEYVPICHNNGQMVRTFDETPCDAATPRRCHECFPEISPQAFFMRTRFIRAHLDLVDAFVAPSRFLAERYAAWGIPDEKILVEENGSTTAAVRGAAGRDEPRRPRNRLAFFGQLTPYKGVHVLLEAMKLLAAEGVEVHLDLHASNLDLQESSFRAQLESLLAATSGCVSMMGRYDRDEVADRMAAADWVVVPSIWWENSPLVIQEAFAHGRPVISSDIGGMAEKVADGVNGLHFRANDPADLARTISRAVTTPGLWGDLQAGIPPVHTMPEHVATLTELYENLLERREAPVWA